MQSPSPRIYLHNARAAPLRLQFQKPQPGYFDALMTVVRPSLLRRLHWAFLRYFTLSCFPKLSPKPSLTSTCPESNCSPGSFTSAQIEPRKRHSILLFERDVRSSERIAPRRPWPGAPVVVFRIGFRHCRHVGFVYPQLLISRVVVRLHCVELQWPTVGAFHQDLQIGAVHDEI